MSAPRQLHRPAALRAALTTAAGIVLVVTPLMGGGAAAQTTGAEAFTGYTLLADADTVTLTGGDPTSQGFPQVAMHTAHSATSLATGLSGHALASQAWPGDLVGNAGSLANLFVPPDGPVSTTEANYRVRAEAFSSGPTEASMQPGMTASAKGPVVEALSESPVQPEGDVITVGASRGFSRSTLVDGVGVSRAESTVKDISLAGGQVKIASVVTVAEARTDGTTGVTAGKTVISGLEIGGQPATIDADGMHFGDSTNPNPADAVSKAIADNVLTHLGMKLQFIGPQVRSVGGLQEYRSGALLIYWDVFDQGSGIGTFAIGGANAFVQATPAGAGPIVVCDGYDPETGSFIPCDSGATPPAPPTDGGGSAVLSDEFDFVPDPVPASAINTDPAPPTDAGGTEEVAFQPVSAPEDFFSGISPALLLLSLAGVALAGKGLLGFQRALIAAPAHTCPLEGDRE